jgi:hypothetical protein
MTVADSTGQPGPTTVSTGRFSARSPFNLRENVIAQATAIITLTSALIIGGGALCLIFRLVYLRVSFGSVLGQLPDSLYLWSGLIEVSIPAVLMSFCFVWLDHGDRFEHTGRRIALIVVSVAVFVGVGLLLHLIAARHVITNLTGGPWPEWVESLIVALIGAAAVVVASTNKVRRQSLLVGTLVGTIAFTFVVASIGACTLLPNVSVCGPSLRTDAHGYHELSGNLIGISGDYAYVAQWDHSDGRIGAGYIAVVPLATQSLVTIGTEPGCGDIQPP